MCKVKKMLVDLKAKQENGTYTLCPRCGRPFSGLPASGVKSKIADILICKQCAIKETGLEKMNNIGDVYDWYALQPTTPAGDFKAVKGETAWNEICKTQKDTILDLYRANEAGEHEGELAYKAQEQLVGLTSCHFRPFYFRYRVLDGTLVIHVEEDSEGLVLVGGMTGC